MTDPVAAAARGLIASGLACVCGRPCETWSGSQVNPRSRQWREVRISCGDVRCMSYSLFGGPSGRWEQGPIPAVISRVGRGKTASAVVVLRAKGFLSNWEKKRSGDHRRHYRGHLFAWVQNRSSAVRALWAGNVHPLDGDSWCVGLEYPTAKAAMDAVDASLAAAGWVARS